MQNCVFYCPHTTTNNTPICKPAILQHKIYWQGFVYIASNKIINSKLTFMRSILYIIAVVLVIGWLLGVFVYSAAGLIHILLVLAVVSIILAVIQRA